MYLRKKKLFVCKTMAINFHLMPFAMAAALKALLSCSYIRPAMKRVDMKSLCRNNVLLPGDSITGPKE